MSNSALIGALVFVVGGTIVLMNRCEWLKWCDPLPAGLDDIETLIKNTFKGTKGNTQADRQRLADAIESGSLTQKQFNSLPTIGNTQDSNYRSVRQSAPGTARTNPPITKSDVDRYKNANPGTYKPGQILPPAKSNLALSLHGYKMSVF